MNINSVSDWKNYYQYSNSLNSRSKYQWVVYQIVSKFEDPSIVDPTPRPKVEKLLARLQGMLTKMDLMGSLQADREGLYGRDQARRRSKSRGKQQTGDRFQARKMEILMLIRLLAQEKMCHSHPPSPTIQTQAPKNSTIWARSNPHGHSSPMISKITHKAPSTKQPSTTEKFHYPLSWNSVSSNMNPMCLGKAPGRRRNFMQDPVRSGDFESIVLGIFLSTIFFYSAYIYVNYKETFNLCQPFQFYQNPQAPFIMTTIPEPTPILNNPQTKTLVQQPKTISPQKIMQEMIAAIKPILAKSPQSRNNVQVKVLNKFSKNSAFFGAIVEHSSVDVAKNLLKYAQIHEIGKNRTLIAKGMELDNVIIFLRGKFGLLDGLNSQKDQPQNNQPFYYKKIIQNCLKIARDLKRKTKQPSQPNQPTEFKTTKAAMYDITISRYIENQEHIFNIQSLVEGKNYTETVITCEKSTILTINAKIFYDILASFVRKLKSDKISAFRKFQYFNCIDNQRLIQLVDELPMVTMKKGHFVYREGQELKNIYLLLKGCIKITKTVDLFRENPNLFYMDRERIGERKLPFADFSELYNYKPRSKLLQIGITNEMSIFGQEEMFSQSHKREANAQVSSQTAVFYTLDLEKLETSLPDIKSFIPELKQGLFKNQTKKKIAYRQEKLSQLLMFQTKNNMDYFFLEASNQEKQQAQIADKSPRKYKISKVNQIISPTKSQKPKQRSIKDALYHTFNFNKFPLKVNESPKKQAKNRSYLQFSTAQSKIIELVHTMGVRPSSSRQDYDSPQKTKPKTARKHSQHKNTAMQTISYIFSDIHNPLFDIGYFQKSQKQALRVEKQSRLRPITTSQKKTTLKPTSSKKMSLSYVF